MQSGNDVTWNSIIGVLLPQIAKQIVYGFPKSRQMGRQAR